MTTHIPLRIYVAGAFTEGHTATPEQKAANIIAADKAAQALYLKGHWPYCPHTMSARWDSEMDPAFHDYERIVKGLDFAWLRVCDALFAMNTCDRSKGAKMEIPEAVRMHLIIFQHLDDVPDVIEPSQRLEQFDGDFRKARREEREIWQAWNE